MTESANEGKPLIFSKKLSKKLFIMAPEFLPKKFNNN